MPSKKTSLTLLLLLLPVTIAFGWGSVESKTAGPQGQEICTWESINPSNQGGILSPFGDEFSVTFTGNSAQTSYSYPGDLDKCNPQILRTNHTWTDPGSSLTPDQELTFDVSVSWELEGSAECSSKLTSVNTLITTDLIRVEAGNSQFIASTQPSGSISAHGTWIAPAGTSPGERMLISASGKQTGGAIVYDYIYEWVCQKEQLTEVPAITEVAVITEDAASMEPTAPSPQERNKYFSSIPGNTLILVGALCCLVLVAGVLILGGSLILLMRRRNKK